MKSQMGMAFPRLLAHVAMASGLLASTMVWAQECPLVPSQVAELADADDANLMLEFKFKALDKQLAQAHKKNLSRPGGDLLTMRRTSRTISYLGGRRETLMRMWLDERPDSFFAHMFAADYYEGMYSEARGSGPVSSLSKTNLQDMRKHSERAQKHLLKAMELDPSSALPHVTMMVLSATLGEAGGRDTQQWLELANKVDPKNMGARINAVNYLSPRWGGSFELLDDMLKQASKSLPKEAAHYLAYNIVMARASHARVIEHNKAEAHKFYKQALGMCENSHFARTGITQTY